MADFEEHLQLAQAVVRTIHDGEVSAFRIGQAVEEVAGRLSVSIADSAAEVRRALQLLRRGTA
jgi:DeoR/GlpR family transcriptional regulator of sugar metabolism